MYYANTYAIGRAYGGPEEGGWYYDYGQAVSSRRLTTQRKARRTAQRIAKHLDNTEHVGPDSVLDDGGYLVCYTERAPAANYPIERPYYC